MEPSPAAGRGLLKKRMLRWSLVFAAFIGLIAGLWEYSANRDQRNFDAAKNKCEVGCVQDSGGIEQCREYCARHPDHYP